MEEKRKKIKAYLKKVYDTLEDTKNSENGKRYIDMIDNMSDKELTAYMKRLRDHKEQLFVYSANITNTITLQSIKAALKVTNTKAFERVYMVDEVTGKKYLTNIPYMVLQLPIRRVKQFLLDKMSVPESDKKTDMLTGQVIKPDKGSSVALIDMQLMADKGLDKSIIELLKIRGGDLHAYSDYVNQLTETGEVNVSSIDTSTSPRSAVTASIYLKAMHIDNNLVE